MPVQPLRAGLPKFFLSSPYVPPLPLPVGSGRGAGGKVRSHQKLRFSTTLADQRHGSAIIVMVRKLVINELDQKLKPLRIPVKGSYRGFLDCL